MFSTLFSRASKAGFTMIELMVVIVILVTLVSLGAIGVTQVMKGAERTKRTAFAETVKSAIMAYKNETGEYPLPESSTGSSAVVAFGTVKFSGGDANPDEGNAELIMELLGRDANGRRDPEKRAYITDTSTLYICKGGRRVTKLDTALAGGGISSNDMIGFRLVMNKTKLATYSKMSRATAFAPIRIEFDLELDHYQVTVPGENDFTKVIRLN